jgi:hypothetical protein
LSKRKQPRISEYFQQEFNAGGLPRAHCAISFEGFHMKRLGILCIVLSLVTVVVGGCEKKVTAERKETVTTPDGTTTTTDTHKVESTGSKPPTNTSGEKAN